MLAGHCVSAPMMLFWCLCCSDEGPAVKFDWMHAGVSIKQILSQSAVKAGQAELSRSSAASSCRREERWQNQSLTHAYTYKQTATKLWLGKAWYKDSLGNSVTPVLVFLSPTELSGELKLSLEIYFLVVLILNFPKKNSLGSLFTDPFLFTPFQSYTAGQAAFRACVSAMPRKSTAVEPSCEGTLQETG